ncbi:MAG: helix-turn-helix domain-containing protein [Candidatus Dormibacteraeota bacterium]|nr:helix-turn-helix domain-containing protein [Candidatus Dormibacteraeota bacterium]
MAVRYRAPFDTDIDLSSLTFWSRPFDVRDQSFAWLRRHAPVSWHPPLQTPEVPGWKPDEAGFWAVTTVADIVEVSRHHQLFSSSVGQVNLRPAPFRLSPETARLLGISNNLAYEAAARGEIPTVKIGRRVLVPKAALQRLLGVEAA